MKPRASFVVPAYNAEMFLRETLDSCLEQSIKQVEVVVVNDGSTDGTAELVDFYVRKDSRVRHIKLAENVGRSEARNIGNKEAQADLIMVLDADDKATRNRAKDTITCFEMKKPDLLYGGFVTIDTFGNMIQRFIPEPFNREKSIKFKTHYMCHSTTAYRKGLSLNIRYQPGDYSRLGIDDWRFIWDAHLKGYKFAYLKQPLAYYRLVEGTVSNTRSEEDVLKLKDEFLLNVKGATV